MYNDSPIYVSKIKFSTLSLSSTEPIFDGRHDFLVDDDFAGMAINVTFANSRDDRGVRRKVELTIVDFTLRCPVETRTLAVNIPAQELKNFNLEFNNDSNIFLPGHTYKVMLRDAMTPASLGVYTFHLFDTEGYGHPTEWYTVEAAGLAFFGATELYKTIDNAGASDLRARFILSHSFGPKAPVILPELELRVYYPDGEAVTGIMREPSELFCKSRFYSAEIPFSASQTSGTYYAEVLCLDFPIGGFVFTVDDEARPGEWVSRELKPLDEYSPEAASSRLRSLLPSEAPEPEIDENLDDIIDRFLAEQESREEPQPVLDALNDLTGLGAVKQKLEVYEKVVNFNRLRAENGLPVSDAPLHAMFLGAPGTGKTTVAKLMGRMLRRAGLLSKGHVVVRERATLLGPNYSSESEKTLAAIEEARGGILLIDEAYQLCQPSDPRDPGKFVIDTLLTELANEENRDWMLILAGYPDEMERLFQLNPGFRSRIPESNIYVFNDFSRDELMEIAEGYFSRNRFSLTADARAALSSRLNADFARRDRSFGNARYVINLIQTEILPAMAVRVTSGADTSSDGALTEILAADIPAATPKCAPRQSVGFTF